MELTLKFGNHLFINGDTNFVNEQHTGLQIIPPLRQAEWLSLIDARRRACGEIGSKFFFLLAPDKQSVFRHLLPTTYRFRQAHFLTELACVVDVVPLLQEMARFSELFPETDSHWNHLGAFLAVQALRFRCNLKHPNLDIEWYSHPYIGDLGGKRQPPERSAKVIGRFKARSHLIYDNLVPNNGRVRVFSRPSSESSADLTSLLIFGDSFSYDLLHFLKEYFDVVTHVHGSAFDYRLLEKLEPSVVICEITERFIFRLPSPPDGEPLTDYWRNKVDRREKLEPSNGLTVGSTSMFPPRALQIKEYLSTLFRPYAEILGENG